MAGDVKMVSRGLMRTLLSNPNFIADFPEFSQVSAAIANANKPTKTGGCKGCRKRRVEYNAFHTFLETLKKLPPDKLRKLKAKVGASSLLYNSQNSRTGRYESGKI